jgi:hypothetical protein
MRLLANENLPLDLIEALRQAGHDVAWILNAPFTPPKRFLMPNSHNLSSDNS